MVAPAVPAMKFELRFVPEGSEVVRTDDNGKKVWERVPARRDHLRPVPVAFKRVTGTYREVSEAAVRLNDVQMRSNYLDYLYFPDPVGSTPVRRSDLQSP